MIIVGKLIFFITLLIYPSPAILPFRLLNNITTQTFCYEKEVTNSCCLHHADHQYRQFTNIIRPPNHPRQYKWTYYYIDQC